MGMYDHVICNAPLPTEPPGFAREPGHQYQTKDLDCTLATYEITEDGRLVAACTEEEAWGGRARGLDRFTGEVEFHGSNWAGSADGYKFTRSGEDYEAVTYAATFLDGRLARIEEAGRSREPALPASLMDGPRERATEAEVAERRAREAESLVGREMWLAMGGSEGEPVAVAAEGERELVLRKPDGRFQVIDRRFRDHLLFDSGADARAAREGSRAELDDDRRRYEAAMAAKKGG